MVSACYFFQFAPRAFRSDAMRQMRALAHCGYKITTCTRVATLLQQVRSAQNAADAPVITVLDGRDSASTAAISALRTLPGYPGIVALVDRNDDALMTQLLQSGADTCGFVCASPDLWVATVVRLLWRLGHHSSDQSSSRPEKVESWRLIEQGWALCTPRGNFVALTTGERAFMMTLLNAPQQQATHEELISAVNASYNYALGRTHQSRLGVMVSRMRRKFAKVGTPLPLKSIHNWGYMFVANSAASADDRSAVKNLDPDET